jgi:hypothetical protein
MKYLFLSVRKRFTLVPKVGFSFSCASRTSNPFCGQPADLCLPVPPVSPTLCHLVCLCCRKLHLRLAFGHHDSDYCCCGSKSNSQQACSVKSGRDRRTAVSDHWSVLDSKFCAAHCRAMDAHQDCRRKFGTTVLMLA